MGSLGGGEMGIMHARQRSATGILPAGWDSEGLPMIFQESTFSSRVTGSTIHRLSGRPPGGDTSRGSVLVLHGWGDNLSCHHRAMDLFGARGYRVEGFDWPGNGKSAGRRGDAPGVLAAVELMHEVIASLDEPPVAVYAHSTGGFLFFAYLRRYGIGFPLRWVWLSSPLINPLHNQPWWKRVVADFLATFLPGLTIPTGVTPSLCYHGSDLEPIVHPRHFQNCHALISLRFARDLLEWRTRVQRAVVRLRDPVRFLLTQGDEDHVCHPRYAWELFHRVPAKEKTLLVMDRIRHEPLREPDNARFLGAVRSWLAAQA